MRYYLSLLILSVLVVACQPIQPVANDTGAAPEATADVVVLPAEGSAVESAAVQTLAETLGVSADTISVVSSEAVEWPDSCLGVSDPEVMCASVITPGFLVLLEADGQSYELHTNEDGSVVVQANAAE